MRDDLNTSYQSGGAVISITGLLHDHWQMCAAARANFPDEAAFLKRNMQALRDLRASTGKEITELFYSNIFTIHDAP